MAVGQSPRLPATPGTSGGPRASAAAVTTRRWALWATASVGLLALVTVYAGAPRVIAAWDNLALLDGAWRIHEGQRPSLEYSNPVGPLVYATTALGMLLQRSPSFAAVSLGNAIFLGGFAPLCWYVLRRRLSAPVSFVVTTTLSVVCVADHPLGLPPTVTTYAMLYNRWAWALYAVLLVLTFLPRADGRAAPRRDGGCAGVILGLLLLCKASYAIVGLSGLGVAWATGVARVERRRLLAAAAGATAVLVLTWALLGTTPSAYLRDVVAAGGAQSVQSRLRHLAHVVAYCSPYVFAFAAAAATLARSQRWKGGRDTRPGERSRWTAGVVLAWCVGSSLLLSAFNAADGIDLPTWVVIPFVLPKPRPSPAATERPPRIPSRVLARLPVVGVLAAAAVIPLLVADLASVVLTATRVSAAVDPAQRLDSVRLRDFAIPAWSGYPTAYRAERDVPAMLNDGIRLLNARVPSRDRVFVMAYTDPFAFAMGRQPLTGVPMWWDVGFSFSPTRHPSFAVLRQASWILTPVPRPDAGCCWATVRALDEVYGDYVAGHFIDVARTPQWRLLQRVRIG